MSTLWLTHPLFCFCFVFVPFHFLCWIHSMLLSSMLPLSVLSIRPFAVWKEWGQWFSGRVGEWVVFKLYVELFWLFRNEIITPSIWSFPGLYLENYVHSDIGNASISVLQGQVIVELIPEEGSQSQPKNITLQQQQKMQVRVRWQLVPKNGCLSQPKNHTPTATKNAGKSGDNWFQRKGSLSQPKNIISLRLKYPMTV